MTQEEALVLARRLIVFLETGNVPDGLFTPDAFCDFTMPKWRLQAEGVAGLVALRKAGHPGPGKVPRWRCDATATGFVLEFEERWEQDGKDWYSRRWRGRTRRTGSSRRSPSTAPAIGTPSIGRSTPPA